MAERIQRKRTKGWRKPEGAVIVSRGTKWGNPFKIGETYCREDGTPWRVWDRQSAVIAYRSWMLACLARDHPSAAATRAALSELRGKDLVCWCPLDGEPCHADVLLDLANRDD